LITIGFLLLGLVTGAVAILGPSPWKSALDVHLEKVGLGR